MGERYLIGEHYQDGQLTAVWNSEQPGVTGPHGFEATHRHQAQAPPPDSADGWRYFWSQPEHKSWHRRRGYYTVGWYVAVLTLYIAHELDGHWFGAAIVLVGYIAGAIYVSRQEARL